MYVGSSHHYNVATDLCMQVTLWKETPEGQWVCVSEVDKGQQVQQQTQ